MIEGILDSRRTACEGQQYRTARSLQAHLIVGKPRHPAGRHEKSRLCGCESTLEFVSHIKATRSEAPRSPVKHPSRKTLVSIMGADKSNRRILL